MSPAGARPGQQLQALPTAARTASQSRYQKQSILIHITLIDKEDKRVEQMLYSTVDADHQRSALARCKKPEQTQRTLLVDKFAA